MVAELVTLPTGAAPPVTTGLPAGAAAWPFGARGATAALHSSVAALRAEDLDYGEALALQAQPGQGSSSSSGFVNDTASASQEVPGEAPWTSDGDRTKPR